LNKANATDEAEQGEPDLDILVKLAPRQSRLDAIQAAKARLQERQQQADMARGRTSDDERRPDS
jgi:predicted nucleotidyltransferase